MYFFLKILGLKLHTTSIIMTMVFYNKSQVQYKSLYINKNIIEFTIACCDKKYIIFYLILYAKY